MTQNTFDALVVGAGAGGLFAAARLSHLGYRTLVVERLEFVGGRASTRDIDGFKINNGAVVIETGGLTEETFHEVGAKFDVRAAEPPILYRIGDKDVDVTGGGWGFLLSKLTRQGAKLVSGIGAARNDSGLPEDELSTADWVAKYTKNESVHGIFRNMCGSVFAVGSEELPARVFLTYFTRKSAFKKFGFCPEGTIGVWQALAEVVQKNGGAVWLSAEVKELHLTDGRVTGATVDRGGETVDISCDFAVSDIGPAATVELVGSHNLPADYVTKVDEANRPCSMITVNFASQRKLLKAPGMLSFAKTRRLCYVANFTETCPEMAPEGWHLYAGTAVPKPAVGDFDENAETELLLADLREEIDGFADARILSIAVTRDGWPPQRAVAGFDLPHDTPIANLWNVGDAVKEYANGGTTACAETAKIVVDKIREAYPQNA
ncbi:phytoene desaturase family protein [Mycolicibacterium mucogenicum]|uniref:NAD(P)/FAD-dependent oxidoreductase n=1 Tax=Mycolicibacterium mucogenicum DSM 44124 TaxID=1226753 RepID=A0A8H2JAF4_MYCMU|nr:FAD-dependent oxidoreductase [Mycolicibacterium mucogenicum]KAB7761375.1 amine oxidase [Mycolicibacterium mucogenicum DSM 44124]QPG70200.1 NAD(P)/FAD-dependent oxidoreductase [Mycolicibacterium mucogenicum DSM 44124]